MSKRFVLSSLAAALFAGTLLPLQTASACGAEPYLGEICTFGFNYCPDGFLPADGAELQINQYSALFALYGTYYGGNGTTTFKLPDLRGRTPVGIGAGPGLTTVNIGQQRGQESVAGSLPLHTHALNVSATTAGNKLMPDASYNYLAGSVGGPGGANIWANTSTTPVQANATTISPAGSGGAATVATIPPQLGLRHCVAINGIFPPRP